MKIYVSWENREILTEEEYQEQLKKYLEECLKDRYTMDEFLETNYTVGDVWLFSDEERKQVLEDAREQFTETFFEEADIETREISITMQK